jgi:hypothetical protein
MERENASLNDDDENKNNEQSRVCKTAEKRTVALTD